MEDNRISTTIKILAKKAILYAAVFIAVIAYGASLIMSLLGDFPNPAAAVIGTSIIILSVLWCVLIVHLLRTNQVGEGQTLRENWVSASKSRKAFIATTLIGLALGVLFFIVGGGA